ncbi:hypothetical protein N0V86_003695 [Didymella sp. IMI 355093]|nr:hypothetical protein N0V86_003695 [Didymella sp. IMI 355093]
MKQSMVLLAAIAGAATAQNLGACAVTCINNMRLIANTELSCPAGDQACFCSRSNWAYGVRDCSRQACDAEQATQAINYAQNLCQGVASSISSGASANPDAALTILNPALSASSDATMTASGESASMTGDASQSAITTVPLVAPVTNSDGSVMTTTTGFSTVYSPVPETTSSAITTVPLVAPITNSDGSVITTTTGFSTVYSAVPLTSGSVSPVSSVASSLESALSSALSSAASGASSATDSAASAASSATGAVGSAASSAASAAGSAASSAASSGSAAKVTGLPVAAGLAFAAYFL